MGLLRKNTALLVIVVVLSLLSWLTLVQHVSAGMDLSKYTLTWNQDFTQLSNLSFTPWGPNGPNGSDWIAHTPYAGDWNWFLESHEDYLPFHMDSRGLTIRAQKYAASPYGYAAGLLSSVDGQGRGFTQKYGYFEMKAKLPGINGTWPAFWLQRNNLVGKETGKEIDILEQYGWNNNMISTLHHWTENPWGTDSWYSRCDLFDGFHTYGLDLQPDYLTFYFDRLQVWQYPNQIPNTTEKFDEEYYILVNLAYGGYENDPKGLDAAPADMLVEYVKVWQGSGGSAKGSDPANNEIAVYRPTKFDLKGTQPINLLGVQFALNSTGNLVITDWTGKLLWASTNYQGQPRNCTTPACHAYFQSDGNFIMYDTNGSSYWWSNTWSNNVGYLILTNKPPYWQILWGNCSGYWNTGSTVAATPLPGTTTTSSVPPVTIVTSLASTATTTTSATTSVAPTTNTGSTTAASSSTTTSSSSTSSSSSVSSTTSPITNGDPEISGEFRGMRGAESAWLINGSIILHLARTTPHNPDVAVWSGSTAFYSTTEHVYYKSTITRTDPNDSPGITWWNVDETQWHGVYMDTSSGLLQWISMHHSIIYSFSLANYTLPNSWEVGTTRSLGLLIKQNKYVRFFVDDSPIDNNDYHITDASIPSPSQPTPTGLFGVLPATFSDTKIASASEVMVTLTQCISSSTNFKVAVANIAQIDSTSILTVDAPDECESGKRQTGSVTYKVIFLGNRQASASSLSQSFIQKANSNDPAFADNGLSVRSAAPAPITAVAAKPSAIGRGSSSGDGVPLWVIILIAVGAGIIVFLVITAIIAGIIIAVIKARKSNTFSSGEANPYVAMDDRTLEMYVFDPEANQS